jgi:hypothetical protein
MKVKGEGAMTKVMEMSVSDVENISTNKAGGLE